MAEIMDISSYLRRIDYSGSREPSTDVLHKLHQAHLLTVPFENLDIHLGHPIVLGEAHLFNKIVNHRRGGFCYELNGLFAALLRELGFEVLGFPCNDFGGQEPGTNEEIQEFCSLNYNVTFPMFDKVKVKGKEKHPLFKMLTDNSATGKSSIKWNFEKFIVDKNGNVVERFRTATKPDSKKVISIIEEELSK